MNTKTLTGIFFIAFIIFFASCNSDKVKTTDKTTTVIENSVDSLAMLENVIAVDSLNIDLRLAIASRYYKIRKFDNALEHLMKAEQIDKNNIDVLIGLGNVYYDTENFEDAIGYYEKVLKIEPENTNVRCDMATCFLSTNKPEKALSLLKKNLEIDKNHLQSHHNLSIVYKQMGKTKEADEEKAIYEKLIK